MILLRVWNRPADMPDAAGSPTDETSSSLWAIGPFFLMFKFCRRLLGGRVCPLSYGHGLGVSGRGRFLWLTAVAAAVVVQFFHIDCYYI